MDHAEKALIKNCLRRYETLKEAANALGIDVSTLVRKKQKHKILK
jgi:transcriptional regulator with PAS, ATPase and Fis domain